MLLERPPSCAARWNWGAPDVAPLAGPGRSRHLSRCHRDLHLRHSSSRRLCPRCWGQRALVTRTRCHLEGTGSLSRCLDSAPIARGSRADDKRLISSAQGPALRPRNHAGPGAPRGGKQVPGPNTAPARGKRPPYTAKRPTAATGPASAFVGPRGAPGHPRLLPRGPGPGAHGRVPHCSTPCRPP